MSRYSGLPNGAAASLTSVPTNHWSASRRRYEAETCHSPFLKKLSRCPPKLGDVKRTGIHPWANTLCGRKTTPLMTARHANPRLAACDRDKSLILSSLASSVITSNYGNGDTLAEKHALGSRQVMHQSKHHVELRVLGNHRSAKLEIQHSVA